MRSGWLIASVLFVFLVAFGGQAVANDPPSGAASTDHAKAAADPFQRALDLTVWTIVVFLLMLIILRVAAWKPLLGALQAREKAITDAIENAKKDREEAARLREKFQQELNTAAQQVRAMLDEGRRDVQLQKDEMIASARTEIQTEKERLRREIDMARDQALSDIWTRTVELATALSTTTIRRKLSPDDHRALVNEALAGLGEAGAEWRRRGGGQSA